MTAPLYAAILIGGKSRRMGTPKHLLTAFSQRALEQVSSTFHKSSSTWLERAITLLQTHIEKVVIVGEGKVPASCAEIQHISDIDGVAGPLAGVLAAMRFAPDADWLILACDMPAVSEESLLWLLQQRHEIISGIFCNDECWGIVPKLSDDGYVEPLFALYFSRAKVLFEQQYRQKRLKIGLVAQKTQIITPIIPKRLATAWQNINTPEQLLLFTK